MARIAEAAEEAERERAEAAAETAAEAAAETAAESANEASIESDAEADAAEATNRAEREAAEAAARLEAEQVEQAYDQAILAADEAYERQAWMQAKRLYDEALVIKPADRYAKSRKERAERAANRAAEDTAIQRNEGPLSGYRANDGHEREAAREADRQKEAAEALKAQLQADQQAQRDRDEAQRQEQAERERRRAEKLAQQMNNSDKDEVEAYYKAALESEAEARMQLVEERKDGQEQLLRDAQRIAAERVGRDLQAQKDIARQSRGSMRPACSTGRTAPGTGAVTDRIRRHCRTSPSGRFGADSARCPGGGEPTPSLTPPHRKPGPRLRAEYV